MLIWLGIADTDKLAVCPLRIDHSQGRYMTEATIAPIHTLSANASIPTPQPVHYRPMFASFGSSLHATRTSTNTAECVALA